MNVNCYSLFEAAVGLIVLFWHVDVTYSYIVSLALIKTAETRALFCWTHLVVMQSVCTQGEES